MREFLSARDVPFTERNIRHDPAAKADLLALTNQLVVPVVVAGGQHVVGFNAEWLESILSGGGSQEPALPPRDSALAEQGPMAARLRPDLPATIADLVDRIREELRYNAAKGTGPYRQGMHDGLRFAEDALAAILEQAGNAAPVPESPRAFTELDA